MENKDHMLSDDDLETVSGGTEEGEYRFQIGELVSCWVGCGDGGRYDVFQAGRVEAYCSSRYMGMLYSISMRSVNKKGQEVFSGDIRTFLPSQVFPYNGY